jgi:hypothetical protein
MEEIREGYTRVSSIVGWFKANELAKIDPQVLQNAADRGTNVHRAIEGFEQGIYVPLETEKERGCFESFKKWRQEHPLILVHEEKRFYCDKFKITGAIDCVAQDPQTGELFIIDFKTTQKEDPIGWPLQGGFYHHLATVNGISLSPFVHFVQLQKDGSSPDVWVYPITSNLYLNMTKCYEVYNLWHLKKKEVLTKLF